MEGPNMQTTPRKSMRTCACVRTLATSARMHSTPFRPCSVALLAPKGAHLAQVAAHVLLLQQLLYTVIAPRKRLRVCQRLQQAGAQQALPGARARVVQVVQ